MAEESKTDMAGPEPLTSFPVAFKRLGAKINELCAWFRGLTPGPGISITKSKGRTIIGIATGKTTAGGSGTEGAAIDIVGSDGKLNKVPKHSTWATPSTYPTETRTVNTGRTVRADGDGLSVEGAIMDFRHDPVTGVTEWNSGSYTITINESELNHNMGIKTIAVCDSGSPASMDIIASDPY